MRTNTIIFWTCITSQKTSIHFALYLSYPPYKQDTIMFTLNMRELKLKSTFLKSVFSKEYQESNPGSNSKDSILILLFSSLVWQQITQFKTLEMPTTKQSLYNIQLYIFVLLSRSVSLVHTGRLLVPYISHVSAVSHTPPGTACLQLSAKFD